MNNDARMDIRIPSDLKHELSLHAVSQDRSKAWVIIQALKQYLSIPKPNLPTPTKQEGSNDE